MIDGSEKRKRQLPFELQKFACLRSAVIQARSLWLRELTCRRINDFS